MVMSVMSPVGLGTKSRCADEHQQILSNQLVPVSTSVLFPAGLANVDLTVPYYHYNYHLKTANLLYRFSFNSHSGGWSPNSVHSARRPFTGLLYLPRLIVRMENLVE
jgi:hypothetical protein